MADVATLSVLLRVDDQLSGALRGAQDRMRNFGRNVGEVGRGLVALSAPLAGVFALGAKSAMGFEQSLSRIVGLVGIASDQVAAWGDEVKDMAVDVGKAPNELAEALFFVTSAGLRGSEAIDALRASARAASAGLGETKTVADALTSAMNAYGGANLSAEQSASILVATVREGKIEAESLAPALGRVIPIAAEMGVSFDQIGAALAAMTRIGLDANESTTALRATLNSLLAPTSQAEEALGAMGLSAAGLRQQLREEGLLSVLEILSAKFEGNVDAMTAVFPNIRALTGVLALMGKNADNTRIIFDSLAQTTTEDLDKAFEAAANTSAFQLQQAMVGLRLVAMELGSTLIPILSDILTGIKPLIESLLDWVRANPELARTVGLVAIGVAGLGAALMALGLMLPGISAVLGAFGAAVGLAATVVTGLGIVLGVLLSPIGLIAGAIALLAVAWVRDWGGIRDKTKTIIEFVVDIFQWLGDIVPLIFQGVSAGVTAVLNFVIDRANNMISIYNKLPDQLQPWDLKPLEHLEIDLGRFVTETKDKVWTKLSSDAEEGFQAASASVMAFVADAKRAIGDLPETALHSVDWIVEQFNRLTGQSLPSLSDIIDTVKGHFGDLGQAVATQQETMLSGFEQTVSGLEAVGEQAKETAQEIVTAYEGVEDAASRALAKVFALGVAPDIIEASRFGALLGVGASEMAGFPAALRRDLGLAAEAGLPWAAIEEAIRDIRAAAPGLGGKQIEALLAPLLQQRGPFGLEALGLPKMAQGGIVRQPTLALVGERGPEAVVPLSRGGGMGMTVNVSINGPVYGITDLEQQVAQIWRDTAMAGGFRGLI